MVLGDFLEISNVFKGGGFKDVWEFSARKMGK